MFVVSADLDEIFAISDRILVIYRGRIVADLQAAETDAETVGHYMSGVHDSLGADMGGGAAAGLTHA